jgi:aminocarboxymuconate-semialdehyde decarboxylase
MTDPEAAAGPSDAIDVHAHHVDADAVAEMGRLAPDRAPRLRAVGDGGWAMDLPPGFFAAYPDGTSRAVPFGLIDYDCRRADMDEQGIRTHVLSGYTYLNFYHLPGSLAADFYRIHNDAVVAAARRDPARFVALPGLPLQDPDRAAAEVVRLGAVPEVAGLGIGSNAAGRDLDDPAFEPMWAAIDRAGLPVLIHPPGQVAGSDRLGGYHLVNLIGNPLDSTVAAGRIILSGLLERHRALRLCFVHGGGFVPYQLGRWDHGWRMRADVRERTPRMPSEYLPGRVFFDSLTHDPTALRFLGERVGWEHVLLGTDYPWDMATTRPIGTLLDAGLDAARRRQIAVDNIRAWLRPTPAMAGSDVSSGSGS